MRVLGLYLMLFTLQAQGSKAQNVQEKDSVSKNVILSELQLMRFTGEYDINWFASVVITVENGKLISQVAGHGKEELVPESEFRFKNITKKNTYYEFVQDAKGKIISLKIAQGSKTITAEKDE